MNVVLNNIGTIPEENCETGEGVDNDQIAITSNMHPLYLQNIDQPGLVLIAKKLTWTENFGP